MEAKEKDNLIKVLKKEFREHQLIFKPRDICSFNEGWNSALDLAIEKINYL